MLSLVSLGVPDYVFVLPLLTIHVATHQFFLAGLGVIHVLRLQSFLREGQTLGSAVEQGSDTRRLFVPWAPGDFPKRVCWVLAWVDLVLHF